MSALLPRPRAGEPGVFDVHVPADLPYFQGHFDGHPVLAAVVQLELLVLRRTAAVWPELTRLRRLTRLRFRTPILPGDTIELRLERAPPETPPQPLPKEGLGTEESREQRGAGDPRRAPGGGVSERVHFEIRRAGEVCSSGTLHFAGEADP
jgi:hypothetical protein